MAGCIKTPLDRELDLSPCDIVLDGGSPPPKGHSPHFLAHVCCAQMDRWIKMPLGIEVGLGPDNIVLDGDPAPPEMGTAPPLFSSCVLWPNGWMDQDAIWYGGRPRPRPHFVRWEPSSFPPLRKGHSSAPSFRLMSIVAKQSLISVTAEHLLKFLICYKKLVLAPENWFKGSSTPSIRNQMVDEEWMRPDHLFEFMSVYYMRHTKHSVRFLCAFDSVHNCTLIRVFDVMLLLNRSEYCRAASWQSACSVCSEAV